jgi:hypothetical protein
VTDDAEALLGQSILVLRNPNAAPKTDDGRYVRNGVPLN